MVHVLSVVVGCTGGLNICTPSSLLGISTISTLKNKVGKLTKLKMVRMRFYADILYRWCEPQFRKQHVTANYSQIFQFSRDFSFFF